MTQLKAMMQAGESVPNAPTTRRFENYCSCGLHSSDQSSHDVCSCFDGDADALTSVDQVLRVHLSSALQLRTTAVHSLCNSTTMNSRSFTS